jgi:excisionase family DNA binding protein
MLDPGKLAYGIKEVGRVINTGQSTVYEYIKEGKIRAVKHGRRTLILAEDLQRYLNSLPAIPARRTDAGFARDREKMR